MPASSLHPRGRTLGLPAHPDGAGVEANSLEKQGRAHSALLQRRQRNSMVVTAPIAIPGPRRSSFNAGPAPLSPPPTALRSPPADAHLRGLAIEIGHDGPPSRSHRNSFHASSSRPGPASSSPVVNRISFVHSRASKPSPGRMIDARARDASPYLSSSAKLAHFSGLIDDDDERSSDAGSSGSPYDSRSGSWSRSSERGWKPNPFQRYHLREQAQRGSTQDEEPPQLAKSPAAALGTFGADPGGARETSSLYADPDALGDERGRRGLRTSRSGALLTEKAGMPVSPHYRKSVASGPMLAAVHATATPPESPESKPPSLPRTSPGQTPNPSLRPASIALSMTSSSRFDTPQHPPSPMPLGSPASATTRRRLSMTPTDAVGRGPSVPASSRARQSSQLEPGSLRPSNAGRSRSSTVAGSSNTGSRSPAHWMARRLTAGGVPGSSAIPDELLQTAGMTDAERIRYDTQQGWTHSQQHHRSSYFPPPSPASLAPSSGGYSPSLRVDRSTFDRGESVVHRVILKVHAHHPAAVACRRAIVELRNVTSSHGRMPPPQISSSPQGSARMPAEMIVRYSTGYEDTINISQYDASDIVRKVYDLHR